jgi:hypothetical protein
MLSQAKTRVKLLRSSYMGKHPQSKGRGWLLRQGTEADVHRAAQLYKQAALQENPKVPPLSRPLHLCIVEVR